MVAVSSPPEDDWADQEDDSRESERKPLEEIKSGDQLSGPALRWPEHHVTYEADVAFTVSHADLTNESSDIYCKKQVFQHHGVRSQTATA